MELPPRIKEIVKTYRTTQTMFGKITVHDLLKYIYELHAKIEELSAAQSYGDANSKGRPESYPNEQALDVIPAGDLGNMIINMPLHWSLEHVATSGPYQWCVYDTDDGRTLSGSPTPQEALRTAAESPLSLIQAKYLPRYAWSLVGKKFKLI